MRTGFPQPNGRRTETKDHLASFQVRYESTLANENEMDNGVLLFRRIVAMSTRFHLAQHYNYVCSVVDVVVEHYSSLGRRENRSY